MTSYLALCSSKGLASLAYRVFHLTDVNFVAILTVSRRGGIRFFSFTGGRLRSQAADEFFEAGNSVVRLYAVPTENNRRSAKALLWLHMSKGNYMLAMRGISEYLSRLGRICMVGAEATVDEFEEWLNDNGYEKIYKRVTIRETLRFRRGDSGRTADPNAQEEAERSS